VNITGIQYMFVIAPNVAKKTLRPERQTGGE